MMEPPTDDDEEGRSSEAKNILTAMPTFARSHTTHMLDAANKRTNQGSPRSLPALRPHAVHPSSAPLAGGGDRYVVVASPGATARSATGGLDHHCDGFDDHHHAARATAPLPQPAHDVVMGATGRQFTARHTAGLHSDGRATATQLGPTERKTMLNDRQYRREITPEASAPPSRRSSFSKMVPTLRSTAELSRMIFGRKDRAKAAVFGREAVLGGMTLTLAQLEEHDEHRSHILEQAFRPDTLRSLLTSFGTVMPDVLSSVFLWLSLGILAATISLRRLDVGRRHLEIDAAAQMTINVIGGFLSFLVVFFQNENFDRFKRAYDSMNDANDKIVHVAMTSKAVLPVNAARMVVRYCCASAAFAVVGLVPRAYNPLTFLPSYIDKYHLLLGDEYNILQKKGFGGGDRYRAAHVGVPRRPEAADRWRRRRRGGADAHRRDPRVFRRARRPVCDQVAARALRVHPPRAVLDRGVPADLLLRRVLHVLARAGPGRDLAGRDQRRATGVFFRVNFA